MELWLPWYQVMTWMLLAPRVLTAGSGDEQVVVLVPDASIGKFESLLCHWLLQNPPTTTSAVLLLLGVCVQ